MRGTHNDLVITTSFDEATETEVPLLHFPIQICKATGDTDVKYDGAAPSGAEYETQYVDTATGEVFDYADRKRGIRSGDGFIEIPEESIEAIDQETTLVDMRVERTVPYEEVPFERATGFYYLQVPSKTGAHKVYKLIYEALLPRKKKGSKKARPALALRVKFSARKRQKLGVVYADAERQCLVMNVLTFAADMREPDEAILAHLAAQVEEEQIDKARSVLEALAEPVDPATKKPREVGGWDMPHDEAIDKKRELVEQAAAGESIEVSPVAKVSTVQADQVSDLLDASLAGVN